MRWPLAARAGGRPRITVIGVSDAGQGGGGSTRTRCKLLATQPLQDGLVAQAGETATGVGLLGEVALAVVGVGPVAHVDIGHGGLAECATCTKLPCTSWVSVITPASASGLPL